MNSDLLYYISNNAGSLSIQEILLNFLAAVVLGGIIFLSYRFSHAGMVYSNKFNVSLWMLTLVTTLVMCVIGNNIALSLGMVGALSIVRFRTAIKDSRDAVYIFWCVAVGICCGISDFIIASIGSTVIFLVLLFIGNMRNNDRYLIIIRCTSACEEAVEMYIKVAYHGKAILRVRNTTRDSVEYIYEVSNKLMKKYGDGAAISNALYEYENVSSVNFIAQNDEIHG